MTPATLSSPSSNLKSATHTRQQAYALDLVRCGAAFDALAPYWDALVEQMTVRTPFLRWDWVRLWWEECGSHAKLAVAILRDAAGTPQAIAPLMLARENQGARRHLTALAFLGSLGAAHGERLDFIVPAGREDDLTPLLCQAFALLRPECDVVRLNSLPQESANTPHILAALQKDFVRAGILNRHSSRYVSLPRAWHEIEARHSTNWRRNLERSCKLFAKDHAGACLLSNEGGISHVRSFEELRRLHDANLPAEESTFTTPESLRFHRRLAARWLPQNRAILPLLTSHGTVISAIYGFIEREEFFLYQMGWDESLARLSPGKMAVRWSIINAIGLGLHTYDMLPGEYEYKRQWCDATRWLLDLEAANPTSWRATVFHTLRTVRRWLAHRKKTGGSFA